MSAGRTRRLASGASALVLVASLVALARALPVDAAVERLREWLADLGWLGPLAFAAIYVVAGLALVPGSAMTLAAGAVFGVALGTAVVSVASTVTAALAFLVARHLARRRVERLAARSPRFAAIDRAIGAEGWKVVGLLRLSPALPFNVSNYLYGLTSVRFWPYVLASWVGMLPGTLLYVVLGEAGAKGLRAAAGDEGGVETGRVVLLAVGLVATIVVTVLVTRAARKALARREELAPALHEEDAGASPSGGHLARYALPAAAALALAAAIAAWTAREPLAELFGAREQAPSNGDAEER